MTLAHKEALVATDYFIERLSLLLMPFALGNAFIKGENPERQSIEKQNSSHQAVQGEFLNQTNHKYALCLQEVNLTTKFIPQVDVEASEPKIVSIDRVKVKSGLIIIDNPSGGEPGQKEYLVKSKRI